MRDCPNAEMRDQLPAYVHGRLDASARAAVEAHLAGCADCAAEIELLQSLAVALSAKLPVIDSRRIVAALPKPGASSRTLVPWRLSRWRAAAVLVFMAGASTLVLLNRSPGRTPDTGPTPPASTADAFSFAGGVSDLSEADLKQLLSDVDHMDAMPVAESDDFGVGGTVPGASR